MTEDRMALNELMQKACDGDFLRSVAETVLQILMEADVEGLIGAGRHGLIMEQSCVFLLKIKVLKEPLNLLLQTNPNRSLLGNRGRVCLNRRRYGVHGRKARIKRK